MWLVAAIVFFIIEAIVPGLISLWFGIAAMITMILSSFIKNFLYEFYVFIVLSGIIFLLTKKISKSWRTRKIEQVDRIIGSIVEISDINDKGFYEIYLDGKNWTGKCIDSLEVGEKAKVIKIEGIKLILEKIEQKKYF